MNRFGYGIILMLLLVGISLPGAVFAQGAVAQGPIIREITFTGLQHIPSDAQLRLHEIIKSKIGQPYSKETATTDEQAIRDQGWFRSVRSETEPVEGGVRLIFTVVEAPVITGVEFVGNTQFTSMKLLTLISTRTLQVLNRNTVGADARAIEAAYAEKGFTQTRVQDITLTDDNKLIFTIFEPKIGEIRIDGNTKTRDYVVRRQLTFHPGDVYNVNTVNDSLRNLDSLGIFQDIVAVPEPGTEPGTLIETVRVKERRTGLASVGVGHSNIEGLIGFVDLADTNLLGTGQNLSARVQFGADNSYELTYSNPWIDPKRTSFTMSLYNRTILREAIMADQNSVLYDEKRLGGSMSFGRPIGRNTTYYVTLRADKVRATNDNNDVVPEILLQQSDVRSVALSRVHDTRNNFLTPSAGGYTSVAAEFAGLGGAKFTKYTGELRHYWNLNGKSKPPQQPTPGSKKKPPLPLVFASRFMVGTIAGAPPTLDQFLIGGADSLRGYKEDRYPGERMMLWNNELRVPFSEALQGVLFADAGDAWQGQFASQFGDNAFHLHYGYGVGIRVVTPIGPLRLDYGFNGEGGHEFHFGVGSTF